VSDPANTIDHGGAPLAGRSVLITRMKEQAAALARPLEALGAEVLAMPVLEIADPPEPALLDEALRRLASYDWVLLTSTNAVDRFLARAATVDGAMRALPGVKLAAIGRGTADHMRAAGLEPDLMPEAARGEGLAAALVEHGVGAGSRVLVPRALKAREVLPETLRALGVEADVVPAYQSVRVPADGAVLARLRAGTVDCVTFTSGAIAEAFFSAVREAGMEPAAVLGDVAVASIGPVTTEALVALGRDADIEAVRATMASLAEAIGDFGDWKRARS
jgi:uroporphyrinogen III methyltransferase / synthase